MKYIDDIIIHVLIQKFTYFIQFFTIEFITQKPHRGFQYAF